LFLVHLLQNLSNRKARLQLSFSYANIYESPMDKPFHFRIDEETEEKVLENFKN